MAVGQSRSAGAGIALLVGAEIVYAIVAAACSSPQTAEIGAKHRADTLMKWVHVGLAQSALFVGLAVYYEPQHAQPIIVGGSVAAVLMYGSYLYARSSGLNSGKPSAEGGGTVDMSAWNNPT